MLQKIYEANAKRGLEIIGITHERGGIEAIRDYIAREKITFPVVLGDRDVAVNYLGISPAKPGYRVPTFFFIDRRGNVVEERSFENLEDREWFAQMPGSLEATVERLLRPKSKVQSPRSKVGRRQ